MWPRLTLLQTDIRGSCYLKVNPNHIYRLRQLHDGPERDAFQDVVSIFNTKFIDFNTKIHRF